jgi:hypothetical protein
MEFAVIHSLENGIERLALHILFINSLQRFGLADTVLRERARQKIVNYFVFYGVMKCCETRRPGELTPDSLKPGLKYFEKCTWEASASAARFPSGNSHSAALRCCN